MRALRGSPLPATPTPSVSRTKVLTASTTSGGSAAWRALATGRAKRWIVATAVDPPSALRTVVEQADRLLPAMHLGERRSAAGIDQLDLDLDADLSAQQLAACLGQRGPVGLGRPHLHQHGHLVPQAHPVHAADELPRDRRQRLQDAAERERVDVDSAELDHVVAPPV